METVFAVTEPKCEPSPRMKAILDLCRSRWELESRNAALEARISEQTALLRDLRERIGKADYQQRELLKSLAKVVDECDDVLQVESLRLKGADPDDPEIRQARKWYRKVERTRQNLMDRLAAYGVSTRNPAGKPVPDLDAIHGITETNAIPPGEIVTVLRSGLLWNGTILRCSLVVVAAVCETPDEDTTPPQRPCAGRLSPDIGLGKAPE